jgi:RNA polymerase sigma factor (sigma-70 family)
MTDEKAIALIRSGNEGGLHYLYKKYYRMMVKMIITNNGSEDEAKDVYQDALVVVWQKLQNPDFELSSKISTYIYSICKNLWRKELDRKSRMSDEPMEHSELPNYEREERAQIVMECINALGPVCRQLLMYHYFDGLSMDDIAKKMDFANSDTAKTKKYKCKKRLDDMVRAKYSESDFLD